VTLADSLCRYSTVANIRNGATSFTTTELKTNFLSAALEGCAFAKTTPVHVGGTTHAWDCELTSDNGKRLALFRCSQLPLRPKA
jgi:uncharacterized protein (TIGR00369 family)